MENTGNMFLMLAGIVKFDAKHDTSFFYPKYYPLLRSWADYLNASLPFPAYQLCTGAGHVERMACGQTSETNPTMGFRLYHLIPFLFLRALFR
jgi:hypothetical protein